MEGYFTKRGGLFKVPWGAPLSAPCLELPFVLPTPRPPDLAPEVVRDRGDKAVVLLGPGR